MADTRTATHAVRCWHCGHAALLVEARAAEGKGPVLPKHLIHTDGSDRYAHEGTLDERCGSCGVPIRHVDQAAVVPLHHLGHDELGSVSPARHARLVAWHAESRAKAEAAPA